MRLHGSGFAGLRKSRISPMSTAQPATAATIKMTRLAWYDGPRSSTTAAASRAACPITFRYRTRLATANWDAVSDRQTQAAPCPKVCIRRDPFETDPSTQSALKKAASEDERRRGPAYGRRPVFDRATPWIPTKRHGNWHTRRHGRYFGFLVGPVRLYWSASEYPR